MNRPVPTPPTLGADRANDAAYAQSTARKTDTAADQLHDVWRQWARAVPPADHVSVLPAPDDPLETVVRLSRAGLASQYVVYERDAVWYFAAGEAVTVSADAHLVTARTADKTWTVPTHGRPLSLIAEAFAALRRHGPTDRRAYGWVAFELAHVLHGDPLAAGPDPLLHLLLPDVEVALTSARAEVRAINPGWATRVRRALEQARDADALADTGQLPDVEAQIAAGADAYRNAVALTIGEIHDGQLDKSVLSRAVPLPADTDLNLAASYLAGRRANTPARSFLLDLGGWHAAGFSPETVIEAQADGRVITQPLAGTRALGPDPEENRRLRAELLADSKEVHEHAISVRLVCRELEGVCQPGSVAVEEFMTVKERGSVQHLASRVAGHLRDGTGPWAALAALFPAVTATGVPKAAALASLTRHEPGKRGLYGGAVLTADTQGNLDAALVLRTVFRHEGTTWLRAGAGVMGRSTPEREFEETREKLRSVAPYLRWSSTA
jgi:salicylate synthetase